MSPSGMTASGRLRKLTPILLCALIASYQTSWMGVATSSARSPRVQGGAAAASQPDPKMESPGSLYICKYNINIENALFIFAGSLRSLDLLRCAPAMGASQSNRAHDACSQTRPASAAAVPAPYRTDSYEYEYCCAG